MYRSAVRFIDEENDRGVGSSGRDTTIYISLFACAVGFIITLICSCKVYSTVCERVFSVFVFLLAVMCFAVGGTQVDEENESQIKRVFLAAMFFMALLLSGIGIVGCRLSCIPEPTPEPEPEPAPRTIQLVANVSI